MERNVLGSGGKVGDNLGIIDRIVICKPNILLRLLNLGVVNNHKRKHKRHRLFPSKPSLKTV